MSQSNSILKRVARAILWLLGAIMFPALAHAQFTFTTNADTTLTITGYTGPAGAVTIPTNINGLTVTGIATFSFLFATNLTDVTIPGSVTNVAVRAFYDCIGLTNVVIGVTELCRRLRISRKTAYKWRQRFRTGRLAGLADQKRRPRTVPGRTSRLWLERLRRGRVKHPSWGVRKLRHGLRRDFGEAGLPSLAAMSRWLKRWGLARGRRRRRRGPVVFRRAARPARHSNDVWTVDFKGWYKTGDGTRVEPLTVRDLHSRYGLKMVLLRRQTVKLARPEFVKIFRKNGLPKRIRSDNGSPFGGVGPTGLTRLSAWWIKLGIEVEFITPGRPGENGAHEQFHRVYKAEVAKDPALRLIGQQRRGTRWLKHYNEERPHEALGMEVPASYYRSSRRRLPKQILPWKYPGGWTSRWVRGNGEINWLGKRRFVGEAFVGDYVGLKAMRRGIWRVYFGPLLLGELHEEENGSLRTAKYRHRK
jgi:putative transposase